MGAAVNSVKTFNINRAISVCLSIKQSAIQKMFLHSSLIAEEILSYHNPVEHSVFELIGKKAEDIVYDVWHSL